MRVACFLCVQAFPKGAPLSHFESKSPSPLQNQKQKRTNAPVFFGVKSTDIECPGRFLKASKFESNVQAESCPFRRGRLMIVFLSFLSYCYHCYHYSPPEFLDKTIFVVKTSSLDFVWPILSIGSKIWEQIRAAQPTAELFRLAQQGSGE